LAASIENVIYFERERETEIERERGREREREREEKCAVRALHALHNFYAFNIS
jgi:hypothetical protein